MKLLLDTHTFLWFIGGDGKLSSMARSLIEDPGNERFLSIASTWEMAIKVSIGRLQFAQPFQDFVSQQISLNDISLFNITLDHLAAIASLPFHHRDPFDRLLVAQSLVEKIPVISVDTAFDAYGVTRLW